MRFLFFTFVVCWLLGCRTNDSRMRQTHSVAHAISSELTSSQQEVLKSVVDYAKSFKTKSGTPSSFMNEMTTVIGKEITHLPMYRLDIEKFHSNPTPENLLQSLESVQDSMYFLVSENGEVLFILSAWKKGQQWVPGAMIYGKTDKIYKEFGIEPEPDPVEELLKDSRRTDWKVFKCLFYTYFTYCLDGERFYYSTVGNRNMTAAEACENLDSFIHYVMENQARGEVYY